MRTRFALFNIVVVALTLVALFPNLTLAEEKPLVIAFCRRCIHLGSACS